MKYKLLLILLFVTLIRAQRSSFVASLKRADVAGEQKYDGHNQDKAKQSMLKQGVKTRIRVDKNGNKWIFNENSGEWMHLPPQALPIASNPININGLNVDEQRDDDYADDPFPDVFSQIYQPKGQLKPINSPGNTQSIYGPQYPNLVNNPINQPSLIYGPMPLPNETPQEDESLMNNWQPMNNLTNHFPIPSGPAYPIQREKPTDKPFETTPQRSNREGQRNKGTTLEAFEDPFENANEITKKPKKLRRISKVTTTLPPFEDEMYPMITSGTFESEYGDQGINGNSKPEKQKTKPGKKPFKKPIIPKVPIGPKEPPNPWSVITQTSNQKPVSPSVPTDILNENDTIELYPPVPPEYPTFIYPNNNPSLSNNNNIKPNEGKKEIEATVMRTTETTTTTTTTTTPIPTSASTEPQTKEQTLAPTPIIATDDVYNSQINVGSNAELWRPITLGKRLQTPVPIMDYPTLASDIRDVWKPVGGSYNPVKVPPAPREPESGSWVLPSMGNMNLIGYTTKRVIPWLTSNPITSTTTAIPSSTNTRRRVPTQKKIRRTTIEITTTTTTVSPKTVTKLRNTIKQIKTQLTTRQTTTQSKTTTTTPLPSRRKISQTRRPIQTTVATTLTTPEENEFEIIDDYTETEPLIEEPVVDENPESDVVESEETTEAIDDQNHENEDNSDVEELPLEDEEVMDEVSEKPKENNQDQNYDLILDSTNEDIIDEEPSSEIIEDNGEEVAPETIDQGDEIIEGEIEEQDTIADQNDEKPAEENINNETLNENEEPNAEQNGGQYGFPEDENITEEGEEDITNGLNGYEQNANEGDTDYPTEELIEEEKPIIKKGAPKIQKKPGELWQHIGVPIKRTGENISGKKPLN